MVIFNILSCFDEPIKKLPWYDHSLQFKQGNKYEQRADKVGLQHSVALL